MTLQNLVISPMLRRRTASLAAVAFVIAALSACAPMTRLGMVKQPDTGLQFGSVVENNIFVDPAQFANRKIKVTTRNTSGDPAFYLTEFTDSLKSSYANKGYEPVDSDEFGIRLDVNVIYSGQVQQNLMNEFAFLGAAAGGITGTGVSGATGTAAGIVAGLTLGAILGSYVTEDTYIVVAEVAIGLTDTKATTEKSIIFSRSPGVEEEEEEPDFKPFRRQTRTQIAVFAGGRNTPQSRIADEVRERLIRIVSDII